MLQTLRSWLKLAKKGHAAGRHPRHGRGVSRPLGLEVLESRLNPASFGPAAEVTNLFNYFLNRGTDPQGLSEWTAKLDSGVSLESVARAIQSSHEHQTLAVESYFRAFLDRDSDAEGLRNFVAAAQAGVTEEELIAGFISSQEYSGSTTETSNQDYVRLLYATILHRVGDETGIAAHQSGLDHGANRHDVALGFLRSQECYTAGVGEAYLGLLGRPGSDAELESWAKPMSQGKISTADMRARIAGSHEGAGHLQSPPSTEYVKAIGGNWWTDRQGSTTTGGFSYDVSADLTTPSVATYLGTIRTQVSIDKSLLREDLGGVFQFLASAVGGQTDSVLVGDGGDGGIGSNEVSTAPPQAMEPYSSGGDTISAPPVPTQTTENHENQPQPFLLTSDYPNAGGDSTWVPVDPLPQHVPFSRAREIVDESTIDSTKTMRITLPAGEPVTKWTRLFVIVVRKDSNQEPLNPSAPNAVTGFTLGAASSDPTEGTILDTPNASTDFAVGAAAPKGSDSFTVKADTPTDSVIARWDPSPDLGDHPVYTLTVTGGYMVQKFLTAETSIVIKGLQVAIDNRYTFSVTPTGELYTGSGSDELQCPVNPPLQ